MNRIHTVLLLLFVLCAHPLRAQIEFNGSLDAGISAGGDESAFISNGIPNEYRFLHFSIPQANLFLFAPLNENFFFEGRLQSDTWGEGTLRTPRFTLANITYADPDKNHAFSIGRFVSTVGFYPSRNLTIDRTFIELPLAYSYYVNMSDVYGFWPEARYDNDYNVSDGIMTTIYFGGYSTGLRWDWQIKPDKLLLQASLTSAAPGSPRDYTNLANGALNARLIWNPNIRWQLGFSASHGSFFHLEPSENGALRQDQPLESYRQSVLGFDFRFGYGFWEIIGESIFSNWKVPRYVNGAFSYPASSNDPIDYTRQSVSANVDIRFEPPSITGSYLGLRLDHINFIGNGPSLTLYPDVTEWDKDKFRISVAAGYKFARNIEGKLLLSEQTPFDRSLYTFRAVISTFF